MLSKINKFNFKIKIIILETSVKINLFVEKKFLLKLEFQLNYTKFKKYG